MVTLPKSEREELKEEEEPNLPKELSKTSSEGSVLMEKANKNLEAILKDYKGGIKPDTGLPKELARVP